MRNQLQLFHFLNEHVKSHQITSKGNKLHGKKLVNSRSFKNFTITFLKSGDEVSLSTAGATNRYSSENELIITLGAIASVEQGVYDSARYELVREYLKDSFETGSEYEFLFNGITRKTFEFYDELENFFEDMIKRASESERSVQVFKVS